MKTLQLTKILTCGLVAVAIGSAGTSAAAQSAADHFSGKTVKVITGTGPGGVYGLSGRVILKYMARHMPGKPAMLMDFMPGAGGIKVANYLYNVAPRDGTVIGMLLRDTAANQLINAKSVRFDVTKFNWLGSWGDAINVLTVVKWAPATTLEDAKKTQVVLGGFSPRSSNYTFPKVLNAILGTKFKVVAGYRGGGAIRKAIDQGEIYGWAGFYVGWITKRPQLVRDKKLAHMVQFSTRRYPEYPGLKNVPLVVELAKNEEDRKVFKFISASGAVARSLTTPPGTPAFVNKAIRKAFEDTLRDPAFLKDMKARHLVVIPVSAEEITRTVHEIVSTEKSVVERYKRLAGLTKKKKGTKK